MWLWGSPLSLLQMGRFWSCSVVALRPDNLVTITAMSSRLSIYNVYPICSHSFVLPLGKSCILFSSFFLLLEII